MPSLHRIITIKNFNANFAKQPTTFEFTKMETTNIIKDLLNADNTTRKRAETQLNESRTSNPGALMQLFMSNMRSAETEVAMISCVLFKKYFLDNSEGITQGDYEQMKQAVMDSLDFKSQPILLLKRKGDVLSKIFSL